MERLTKVVDGHVERVCRHWSEEHKMCYGCVRRTACNEAIFRRLAAYEDSGLSPEEVKELSHDTTGPLHGKLAEWMTAEAEGRLHVFPCKVGDKVWIIRRVRTGRHIKSGFVREMYFTEGMQMGVCVHGIGIGEWGKNVFATREEAEAALEGDLG